MDTLLNQEEMTELTTFGSQVRDIIMSIRFDANTFDLQGVCQHLVDIAEELIAIYNQSMTITHEAADSIINELNKITSITAELAER